MERSVTLAEARRRAKGGTLNQLRFKFKRRGGKTTITGAFIANHGRTVFVRTGKTRLPIKAVRTIGVPQMFSTKKNITMIKRWISTNFPRIFEREFNYFKSTVR